MSWRKRKEGREAGKRKRGHIKGRASQPARGVLQETMGQAAGQRNKDRKDGERKEDRGTEAGEKGQGAGQRWRKKQQG